MAPPAPRCGDSHVLAAVAPEKDWEDFCREVLSFSAQSPALRALSCVLSTSIWRVSAQHTAL